MENATKALLIAAAILVAILIISLGLVVYNMAAETVQGVNLDEQTIQAHNDKFIRYEGDAKRGTNVNSLLQQVLNNNLAAEDDSLKVKVTVDGSERLTTGQTTSPDKVPTGATYTVVCRRDEKSKLITSITITTNTTTP